MTLMLCSLELMRFDGWSTGEDGTIRSWTVDRGKLCGTKHFSTSPSDRGAIGDDANRAGLGRSSDGGLNNARAEDHGGIHNRGGTSVPLCALASSPVQPVLAVGLSHGAVHIVFVKQVTFHAK